MASLTTLKPFLTPEPYKETRIRPVGHSLLTPALSSQSLRLHGHQFPRWVSGSDGRQGHAYFYPLVPEPLYSTLGGTPSHTVIGSQCAPGAGGQCPVLTGHRLQAGATPQSPRYPRTFSGPAVVLPGWQTLGGWPSVQYHQGIALLASSAVIGSHGLT